jgi:hypothetical protein
LDSVVVGLVGEFVFFRPLKSMCDIYARFMMKTQTTTYD